MIRLDKAVSSKEFSEEEGVALSGLITVRECGIPMQTSVYSECGVRVIKLAAGATYAQDFKERFGTIALE